MLYSVLLAGGRSSRMGEDKTLLEVDGKTLLQRAHDLLEVIGSDAVLVSGEVPGYSSIPDTLTNCGPLGGLHAVLHQLDKQSAIDEDSLLLVIPVDMPMLEPQVLRTLVDSTGQSDCCHYEGEIFPCVFRLTRRLPEALDAMFADGTKLGGARSMKALLSSFSAQKVSTKALPEHTFLNLNRPGDWQQFLALRSQW